LANLPGLFLPQIKHSFESLKAKISPSAGDIESWKWQKPNLWGFFSKHWFWNKFWSTSKVLNIGLYFSYRRGFSREHKDPFGNRTEGASSSSHGCNPRYWSPTGLSSRLQIPPRNESQLREYEDE
jgi:hypothetical protein